MIQAYSKKEIISTFRQLKRDWGATVQYHKIVTNTVNLETGVPTMEYEMYEIKRAILLPSNFIRELTTIGIPFNYGGEHDSKSRFLFVERKDLPLDFETNLDDFVVIDEVRYSVAQLPEDYGFDTVYIFKISVTKPEKDEVA